ncbi:hypothetical protein ABIA33_000351 [Streptacidiphilus sp. MAP12-16]|uniref:hypothetical protein n=1 Tax=Streptacidiphilus sp. MAP12-16 TaxID=3156300 RepID=UPI0035158902
MSKGPEPDKATKPLPRRGADSSGRIPTQYGPGNPIAKRLTNNQFRFRPGSPSDVAAKPQQPAESAHEIFTAIAEDKAAQDRRRGRLWLGAGLVALLCLVAAGVTLLSSGSGRPVAKQLPPVVPSALLPSAGGPQPTHDAPSPSASSLPSASAKPSAVPLDPLVVISNASTDTAPLTLTTLFPGRMVTVSAHSYTQALTVASACAPAATAPLAAVLVRNGCHQVFRATYGSGTTAATVGVAVFDTAAQANAVKQQAIAGNLEPLSGGAVPVFCHAVACRLSVNAFGRYAYFTVAGYTTGKPVPPADTAAMTAGTDMGRMVFENLATRARAEAVQH